MKEIIIRYHNDNIEKIGKIAGGDWIDLRAAETAGLKAGEFKLISLGVSMKLPDIWFSAVLHLKHGAFYKPITWV